MREKDHETLNQGRISAILLEQLKPTLESQERSIVARIKAEYRAGKATHDMLVAAIAQLCSLEDIETDLRAKVTRSERLREELLK